MILIKNLLEIIGRFFICLNGYTYDTFLGGGGGGGIGDTPYFSVKLLSSSFLFISYFSIVPSFFLMIMMFPCLEISETDGFRS